MNIESSRRSGRHTRLAAVVLPGIILVLLFGCTRIVRPDLQLLYAHSRQVAQPPVIIIHGILGVRLADVETGEEVWFGTIPELLFSNYDELRLEIDPESLEPRPDRLVPTELADEAAGRDYYASIIRTLEQAGSYRRAEPGVPPDPGVRSYYVFAYDWRQDTLQSVRKLSGLIETIRADHEDPELRVDLIAHSMGGLIASYYLRYGELDVLDDNEFPINLHGASHVRRVVLLGTPNLGSVASLHAFIKGYKIGLRKLRTESLATMPSTYQLFPHALHTWIVTADGEPLERDVFDIRTWRRFQWSIFDPEVRKRITGRFGYPERARSYLKTLERYFERHLERARRFVWSLTVELPEQPYELIVFGGDCHMTPARLVVEEVDGVSEIRLWTDELQNPSPDRDYARLMLEPGDGTVTKSSLLARESLDPTVPRHRWASFPIDFPFLLCDSHEALTANVHFQDNLLHTLLSLVSKEN